MTPALRFPGFEGEWEEVSVQEVLNGSLLGGNYANSARPTSTPLMKMGNLSRGNFDVSSFDYVDDPSTVEEAHRLRAGDLILNTRNTPSLVGKVALWRGELPVAYFNSNLLRLDFDCNEFMNLLFNSEDGVQKIKAIAAGTTSVAAIYSKDLMKVRFFVPTSAEQRKIAAFLSAVDARIAVAGRERAGLGRYKAGLLQALLSRTLRFTRSDGSVFPDWEERPLGSFASIEKGEQLNRDTLAASGPYPVINGGVSPSGYTDVFNREGMTVTVSEGGNSCGYVALQRERFWSGGHCFTVVPLVDDVLNDFLYHSLKHSEADLMRLRVGSGLPNVQKGALAAWRLLLPHPDEQARIAAALATLDRRLAIAAREEAALRRFKAGLLQRLFA